MYLSGDFTVTVWHYLKDLKTYRIFDICNGEGGNNNIILMSGTIPTFYIYIGANPNIVGVTMIAGSNDFVLNKWEHLAVTLQGTYLKMYLNGVVIVSEPAANIPTVMLRNYAYLGKSSSPLNNSPNPIGYYDEMRFYSRALNQTEILAVMRV